jgi:WD40 repeat protein
MNGSRATWGDGSPDGSLLAVSTLDGVVAIFDAATYEPTGASLDGEGAGFLAFSPDGTQLAVGSNGKPTVTTFSASVPSG